MKNSDQPNIIFLTIDSLRSDRLGCFGHKPDPSPFLNKLITKGVFASRAYSLGCPTQFVFPSIMTSTMPLDQGGYEQGVLNRTSSWVEALNNNGYQTAGFVTGSYISGYDGYNSGFDSFYELFDLPIFIYNVLIIRISYYINQFNSGNISADYCHENIESFLSRFFPYVISFCENKLIEVQKGFPVTIHSLHGRDYQGLRQMFIQEQHKYKADIEAYINDMIKTECTNLPYFYLALKGHSAFIKPSTVYIMENVKQWIASAKSETPFCVWAHLMDVHDSNYKTHDIRLPVSMERDDILRTALLESRFLTTQDYKGNPTYDMAITYVDNQVRRLVSFLEARGILDNTLIVITADHGLPKGFPNRNLPGLDHFYEEYLRIPMSFIHPALKSEEKSGLVTLLDIGPTILDFAGVPIPDSFQGGSLIRNSWDAKSHIIVEHCGRGPCDFATKPIKMCVIQNNCKIKYINPPANCDGDGYIESLFDLSKDTYETQNLKDDNTYIDTLQEMQGIAKERCFQIRQEN